MSENEFQEENFENLLNESLNRRDNFEVGDRVKGTIVFLSNENIFVDINGKSEAIIASSEFLDKDNEFTIKKGDTIDAYVVSTTGGEINLTTSIGKGHGSPELLEIAYSNEIPIHGTIASTTKGGYTVSISGVNCFCPFSQVDVKSPEDPEKMVHKSFEFKIIQYGEKGKNIVVSRRALLQEMIQEQEENLKESLHIGDTITGTIKNIKNFGVFLDIGGIDALVPKSELSLSRNVKPEDFAPGTELSAKVKAIDWDKKQITLSIKDMHDNPWDNIEKYSAGQELNGKVVNTIKSGAFVELEPGLEGFIHISKMSLTKKISKPEDAVSIGDTVNVKIFTINPEEKRISLELITGEADPWLLPVAELKSSQHNGVVESVKPAGVHLRLENGMLGFIPREQLLAEKGVDIQKAYATGKNVKVSILDINPESKKLILSEKAAMQQQQRKEFQQYMDNDSSQSGSSLGSLFKNQFAEIQKKIDN